MFLIATGFCVLLLSEMHKSYKSVTCTEKLVQFYEILFYFWQEYAFSKPSGVQ